MQRSYRIVQEHCLQVLCYCQCHQFRYMDIGFFHNIASTHIDTIANIPNMMMAIIAIFVSWSDVIILLF